MAVVGKVAARQSGGTEALGDVLTLVLEGGRELAQVMEHGKVEEQPFEVFWRNAGSQSVQAIAEKRICVKQAVQHGSDIQAMIDEEMPSRTVLGRFSPVTVHQMSALVSYRFCFGGRCWLGCIKK